MIALWIMCAACLLAAAANGYLILKLWGYRKAVEEHERNLVCLADALVKTNKNVAGLDKDATVQAKVLTDLIEKFSKVDDLIDAAKDRETKAAQSEKLFQDGFTSIMNYDFNVAMGKKNDDG